MKNILIADANAGKHYSIAQLTHQTFKDFKITETDNTMELFDLIRHQQFDAVVLGDNIRDMDLIKLTMQLKQAAPKAKMLVFSYNPEDVCAPLYMKWGAKGYYNISASNTDFIQCINTILNGGIYMSNLITEKIIMEAIESHCESIDSITFQEIALLSKLARKKSISTISNELGIDLSATTYQSDKLLQKLSIQSLNHLFY